MASEGSSGTIYTPNYYITDHLGSTRAIFDGSPDIARSNFLPYGTRWTNAQAPTSRYQFTGYEDQDLLDNKYMDAGFRLYNGIRFNNPDPLAEKYPWISPYAYCLNNPIIFIDPDGLDIFAIDSLGRVVHRIPSKMVMVYMVNNDGTSMRDDSGNPLFRVYGEGSIEAQEERPVDTGEPGGSYTMFKITGDHVSENLFLFLAENVTGRSRVEVSHTMTGEEGPFGVNYITTSHTEEIEYGVTDLVARDLKGSTTVRKYIHSHPDGKNSTDPSGGFWDGDIGFATVVCGILLPKGAPEPEFHIYHVPTRQEIQFWPIGSRSRK